MYNSQTKQKLSGSYNFNELNPRNPFNQINRVNSEHDRDPIIRNSGNLSRSSLKEGRLIQSAPTRIKSASSHKFVFNPLILYSVVIRDSDNVSELDLLDLSIQQEPRGVGVVWRKVVWSTPAIMQSPLSPLLFSRSRGLFSTLLEVALLRVEKWSVSFAGGRREFRFPTVAIRRSLLHTFGAQLRNINRC